MPIVEDRMARLEKAIDAYVRYRGELAIRNSIAPGLEAPESFDADRASVAGSASTSSSACDSASASGDDEMPA